MLIVRVDWGQKTWAGIRYARMGVVGMSKIVKDKRLRLENRVYRPERVVLLVSLYACFLPL